MTEPVHIMNYLVSKDVRENYPANPDVTFQNHILEQYKLYQSSAENISSRRQTANSFFVSVNTALVALTIYLNLGDADSINNYWVVALAGIAISFMWFRLVRSYRDLNSVKYKVIHEIEKLLPIAPYDAEWEAAGRGKNAKLYLPFTHVEMLVPWIFIFLHAVTFLISFPWSIFG